MKIETPLKAIRIHCCDCQGWQKTEVALCPSVDCALWAYRFGRRPSKEDIEAVNGTEDRFLSEKLSHGIVKSVGQPKQAFMPQLGAVYNASGTSDDKQSAVQALCHKYGATIGKSTAKQKEYKGRWKSHKSDSVTEIADGWDFSERNQFL